MLQNLPFLLIVNVAFLLLLSPQLFSQQSTAILWDSAALQGIRNAKLGAPPIVARALAVVHTCMYDAWAAYDERAVGTELQGALRRPPVERTNSNNEKAISYAAFRALSDVFSQDTDSVYQP